MGPPSHPVTKASSAGLALAVYSLFTGYDEGLKHKACMFQGDSPAKGGSDPEKLLTERRAERSEVEEPIEAGTLPTRPFSYSSRVSSTGDAARLAGAVPLRPLQHSSNCRRDVKFPRLPALMHTISKTMMIPEARVLRVALTLCSFGVS